MLQARHIYDKNKDETTLYVFLSCASTHELWSSVFYWTRFDLSWYTVKGWYTIFGSTKIKNFWNILLVNHLLLLFKLNVWTPETKTLEH